MNLLNAPLVSITCVTYNHGPYLRQCLEGFLIQKTGFSFEILIHDDASTDGTAQIIKEYELKYPDLIFPIYQSENQYSKGNKRILNRFVFPKCRGKYIALCEGDDYWIDPYKLQKQVDILEANQEYSFCFHNASTYFVDRDVYEDFNHKLKSKNYKTKDLLIKGWFIPSASLFIRKEMIPDPFPEWYFKVFSGDYALELLLSTKGDFFYINNKMSVYRKNVNNSLSINGPQGIESLKKQISLLKNFRSTTAGMNSLLINYSIAKSCFKHFRGYIYKRFPFVAIFKDILFRLVRILHRKKIN
jgi:glycosyltransferase involved in cell wall biosynthesis